MRRHGSPVFICITIVCLIVLFPPLSPLTAKEVRQYHSGRYALDSTGTQEHGTRWLGYQTQQSP
ncbi:MAG: hypothetical protein R2568_01975 [Candidatus Scalindua sp.]|nr:hypothetical protein [Candidatus Scalindua sp.]MDV5165498.1 hypothetical protein [Candidatus Scalindua sp.]